MASPTYLLKFLWVRSGQRSSPRCSSSLMLDSIAECLFFSLLNAGADSISFSCWLSLPFLGMITSGIYISNSALSSLSENPRSTLRLWMACFSNRRSAMARVSLLSDWLSIYLRINQLSGPIPFELGSLSSLQSLDLSSNELFGTIPPELGGISSLIALSLRGNELSGMIPPELGGLSSLLYLDMGSNQLYGTIPSELGNLSSLQSLSLVNNQLSGSIPPELGDLSSLLHIYLFDKYGHLPSIQKHLLPAVRP